MGFSKDLTETDKDFFRFLVDWHKKLKPFNLKSEIKDPKKTAIFSTDMIIGFCYQGNLASDRIRKLITPIVKLFKEANHLGIEKFVLMQDAHDPNALEFEAWSPHCVIGTKESETVPEIANLEFSDKFTVIPKNSLYPNVNTKMDDWLNKNKELEDFFVVGNCTDLCVYYLAMYLRVRANAYWLDQRVILPANCVDTYDLPVKQAEALGAIPHPGDLLHLLFLYHMALNGILVVEKAT